MTLFPGNRVLFQAVDEGSHGMDTADLSVTLRDEKIGECRRLRERAETLINVINSIRARPGIERCLKPPAFASLMQSLPHDGFVVVIVLSMQMRCACEGDTLS
jgi:hypothetical protein